VIKITKQVEFPEANMNINQTVSIPVDFHL